MDRAILHDIRNELAVATGSIHAFMDGKLEPNSVHLGRVLAALEGIDQFLTELRALIHPPEQGKERLLQAIVEGSPYAKVLVNGAGTITLVNGQAEALFGYARQDMLGQSIEMLVPARFRRRHPELRNSFNEAPTARPMGAGRELFGRRRDGSEFPIEIGLNPIETEAGTFTLAAVSDITERRRAEEMRLEHAGMQLHAAAVERLNEELASASHFKSQFVATMSHELRTPLTAIIGATELLARRTLDERAQQHVETISGSAEALLSLIGSILDFSKIESGHVELQTAALAIEAVVDSAADVVAQLANAKGVAFHTYVDPAIPEVIGDADRLRQILLNLMANAVKFTDAGQVVARVFPLELAGDRVLLRFEIEDTGIGMDPQVISHLFEPFVQADNSPSRKYGGTGLGLSISKRLVDLMGGEIGADSEPGTGSLFWVTVPFESARQPPKARSTPFENVTGLIVSPDDIFAEIVGRYMDSWGMRCRRVRSRDDFTEAAHAATLSGWVAIVDADASKDAQLDSVVDALQSSDPERTVVIGNGALRKPVRQSHLFDAIAGASDPGRRQGAQARRPYDPAPAKVHAPVLVAEDSVRLQELLRLQFDELGVDVAFVGDGTAAIEALRDGSYSMVFMDCQMPNMDGLTATRAIRESEQQTGTHVPITAMTANAFAEDREACLAAGMDDYLAKPVRLTNLRAMLERWAPATL